LFFLLSLFSFIAMSRYEREKTDWLNHNPSVWLVVRGEKLHPQILKTYFVCFTSLHNQAERVQETTASQARQKQSLGAYARVQARCSHARTDQVRAVQPRSYGPGWHRPTTKQPEYVFSYVVLITLIPKIN
jgi:hypothetical protein